MDEQRLQEMERDFADDDVSVRDYAAHGLALIADVRRLQQEADKALVTHIEAIEQGNGLAQRLIAERDAALAERDALLVRVDQWRQMADCEATAHVEMRAERDAARAERDDARAALQAVEWVREALHGTWGTHCHAGLVAEIKRRTANTEASNAEIARLQQERQLWEDTAMRRMEEAEVAEAEVQKLQQEREGLREYIFRLQSDISGWVRLAERQRLEWQGYHDADHDPLCPTDAGIRESARLILWQTAPTTPTETQE